LYALWGNNHLTKDCHFKNALCHKCNKPETLPGCADLGHPKMNNSQQFTQSNNWVEEIVDDQALFHGDTASSSPFTIDLCIEGKT